MDTIPQELVRAIVDQIDADDTNSLRACSLIARRFRDYSQQILFYALVVGDERPYTVACSLLQESPHIAQHFRRLHFGLPDEDIAPEEVDALCTILDNLPNVRTCFLLGAADEPRPWPCIQPRLSLAVVAFIERQQLEQLHILAIDGLPRAVLAAVLSCTCSLSIVEVSVDLTSLPLEEELPRSIVKNLILASSPGVADVLSSPEFIPRMANLRRLWWEPELESHNPLISLVAPHLEHLRIQYEEQASRWSIDALPRLPSLRVAELSIDQYDGPWLIPRLTSFLMVTANTLQEISIICCPTDALQKETLREIDGILADFPAAPLMRWSVAVDVDGDQDMSYTDFRMFLLEGMPKLLTRSKLVVEESFVVDEGFSDWAMKR